MTKLDYLIMGFAFGYIGRPFIDVMVKIIKNSFKKD